MYQHFFCTEYFPYQIRHELDLLLQVGDEANCRMNSMPTPVIDSLWHSIEHLEHEIVPIDNQ